MGEGQSSSVFGAARHPLSWPVGWVCCLRQSMLQPQVWTIGAVMGLASTLGYWLVMMHCLKIGPIGPTVAMNNMGMLWPVLLGSLWLKPQPLSGQLMLGLGLVSFAMSVMGFGSSRGNASGGLPVSTMSLRWFL